MQDRRRCRAILCHIGPTLASGHASTVRLAPWDAWFHVNRLGEGEQSHRGEWGITHVQGGAAQGEPREAVGRALLSRTASMAAVDQFDGRHRNKRNCQWRTGLEATGVWAALAIELGENAVNQGTEAGRDFVRGQQRRPPAGAEAIKAHRQNGADSHHQ